MELGVTVTTAVRVTDTTSFVAAVVDVYKKGPRLKKSPREQQFWSALTVAQQKLLSPQSSMGWPPSVVAGGTKSDGKLAFSTSKPRSSRQKAWDLRYYNVNRKKEA